MDNKKGWIALDIDGTITLDKYSVPDEVIAYLRQKVEEGWNLLMATGRPYSFASMALSEFNFSYFFSAQNGSIVMQLPEKKVIFKNDIPIQSIALIEKTFDGIESDFVIYAGYEKGDFCYWRPKKLSTEEHRYLEDLQKRQKESWQAVETFEKLEPGYFPLVKCFGDEPTMAKIQKRLEATQKFEVAKIRDPFEDGYFILLVTDQRASKGNALRQMIDLKGRGAKVIAAGDDENDLSLLDVADVKIAMHHAPAKLQQVASFIAPPTKELGILHALDMAIENAY